MNEMLDRRPLLVAIAGPAGAGKTTFFEVLLRAAGLPFVNADALAKELELEPHDAVTLARAIREQLVSRHESFLCETVFSDPVGDKLGFLKTAVKEGYTVVLCFIGLPSAEVSEQRVAMRVSQGGHGVPAEKLVGRFERTLRNLETALRELPHVWVFDNSDLERPFRKVAVVRDGRLIEVHRPVPARLQPLLP